MIVTMPVAAPVIAKRDEQMRTAFGTPRRKGSHLWQPKTPTRSRSPTRTAGTKRRGELLHAHENGETHNIMKGEGTPKKQKHTLFKRRNERKNRDFFLHNHVGSDKAVIELKNELEKKREKTMGCDRIELPTYGL